MGYKININDRFFAKVLITGVYYFPYNNIDGVYKFEEIYFGNSVFELSQVEALVAFGFKI